MPSQVRIISRRNSKDWDDLLQQIVNAKRWREELPYVGLSTQDEADRVRRAITTAARRRSDVSVKAYWKECGGCGCTTNDGRRGNYHVLITIYDPDEARRYKVNTVQKDRR